MKLKYTLFFIVVITLLAVLIDLPKLPKIKFLNRTFQLSFVLKLGLDLQGGTQLVLTTQMDKINESDKDSALESVKSVIERRVNLYGVSEAVVQSSRVGKDRRILIELPGIKDASQAANLIGKTAQLDFREMPATFSAQELEATKSGIPLIFFAKETDLTGADLKKAAVSFGSSNKGAGPQISLEFSDKGAKKFADLTRRNIGNALPIFLDGEPISAPTVQQEIIGGSAVITGQFSLDQAKSLAIQLNAGALPVPVKILEQRSIGPTLGQESINKSLVAGGIGLSIIMIYMVLFYGLFGVIADVALIIYTILILAIFKTGFLVLPPITLTLSGIAGFILSVGMAVDANILIFERIKEELRWGKSRSVALDLGFKRAWSSIWASNISSLITAAILYSMGQGVVRGFAITLAIGVFVSMFTAIVVSRSLLKLIIK